MLVPGSDWHLLGQPGTGFRDVVPQEFQVMPIPAAAACEPAPSECEGTASRVLQSMHKEVRIQAER